MWKIKTRSKVFCCWKVNIIEKEQSFSRYLWPLHSAGQSAPLAHYRTGRWTRLSGTLWPIIYSGYVMCGERVGDTSNAPHRVTHGLFNTKALMLNASRWDRFSYWACAGWFPLPYFPIDDHDSLSCSMRYGGPWINPVCSSPPSKGNIIFHIVCYVSLSQIFSPSLAYLLYYKIFLHSSYTSIWRRKHLSESRVWWLSFIPLHYNVFQLNGGSVKKNLILFLMVARESYWFSCKQNGLAV